MTRPWGLGGNKPTFCNPKFTLSLFFVSAWMRGEILPRHTQLRQSNDTLFAIRLIEHVQRQTNSNREGISHTTDGGNGRVCRPSLAILLGDPI